MSKVSFAGIPPRKTRMPQPSKTPVMPAIALAHPNNPPFSQTAGEQMAMNQYKSSVMPTEIYQAEASKIVSANSQKPYKGLETSRYEASNDITHSYKTKGAVENVCQNTESIQDVFAYPRLEKEFFQDDFSKFDEIDTRDFKEPPKIFGFSLFEKEAPVATNIPQNIITHDLRGSADFDTFDDLVFGDKYVKTTPDSPKNGTQSPKKMYATKKCNSVYPAEQVALIATETHHNENQHGFDQQHYFGLPPILDDPMSPNNPHLINSHKGRKNSQVFAMILGTEIPVERISSNMCSLI